MSLIQEALKRRREERPQKREEQPKPPVAAKPKEIPAETLIREEVIGETAPFVRDEPSPKRPVGIYIGAAVFVGLVLLVISFLGRSPKPSAREGIASRDQRSSGDAANVFRQEASAAGEQMSGSDAAQRIVREPFALAQAEVVETGHVVKPIADPGLEVSEIEASATTWPLLRITGVIARSASSKSSAMISGEFVTLGESIDGVIILEVRETGVMMEFAGEKRFVRVGQTTE